MSSVRSRIPHQLGRPATYQRNIYVLLRQQQDGIVSHPCHISRMSRTLVPSPTSAISFSNQPKRLAKLQGYTVGAAKDIQSISEGFVNSCERDTRIMQIPNYGGEKEKGKTKGRKKAPPSPTSREMSLIQDLLGKNGLAARRNSCREATPSEALISALSDCGYAIDISKPKIFSVDLSWVHPGTVTKSRRTQSCRRKHQNLKKPARLTYATVVANYIRHIHPLLPKLKCNILESHNGSVSLNQSLLKVFDDHTLKFLSSRGYSVHDVMTWTWILTSTQSLKAAQRYAAFEKKNSILGGALGGRVPLFVLLFTLRRRNISAKALRILLLQAWDMLSGSQVSISTPTEKVNGKIALASLASHPNVTSGWRQSGDDTSVMIIIVRLLRAARIVWPLALLSIAEMIVLKFGPLTTAEQSEPARDKRVRRLTWIYNKCLSLIALPCRIEPFHSVRIQQRAQFKLLRSMTKFTPPLTVTREGYQAITSILLAHRKTVLERKWANFKAKSWPPWKEAKLGIDLERGNEGSQSRAMETMSRMRNAGYALTRWEEIAAVFAGWDTDGSPTIQTRAILPKPNTFRTTTHPTASIRKSSGENNRGLASFKRRNTEHDIWVARIRATRTVREAWACFLSYHDEGLSPHKDIYFAMAEKIVFQIKSRQAVPHTTSDALPGDGKEVFPDPSCPRDLIYVNSEPPSLDNLLQRMFSQDIRPSGRFLIFLLVHAKSFEAGFNYLVSSGISPKHIKALCFPSSLSDVDLRNHLTDIPDDVFAAFIGFLCRFPTAEPKICTHEQFPILFSSMPPVAIGRNQQSKALMHAALLMQLRLPKYPPVWHYLLSALSTRVRMPDPQIPLSAQRIIAWREILEVLAWMRRADVELEITGLQIVCSALARAIQATRQDKEGAERGLKIVQQLENANGDLTPTKFYLAAPEMFQEGVDLLKTEFYRLILPEEWGLPFLPNFAGSVGNSGDATAVLPSMFVVPAPAQLHAFIRVLGLAQDNDGLLDLLKWMSQFAKELKLVVDERVGGRKVMRYAIVAIRVFLEGHLDNTASVLTKDTSFPTHEEGEGSFIRVHEEEWVRYDEEKQQPNCVSPQISSDPRVQEAYDLIESTEFLSPWPTDTEVQLYISRDIQRFDVRYM